MYFLWGFIFCIGFIIGIAYGIVKGKKDLAGDLRNDVDQIGDQQLQNTIGRLLNKHLRS